MEREEKQTISFMYKISPTYVIYSISGVHGGISPQGELVVNFFSERHPIPRRTVHEISKEGVLGQEISRDTEESIIRDIFFGISITPKTAKMIAEWLMTQINKYEELIGQKIE